VVHRDIKLENILIDDTLNFRLCDLGAAGNTLGAVRTLPGLDSMVGTMSP
jgi:serine/threonine protein kinase